MNEVCGLRVDAGLTQAELAALSGVAQPNIAAYESGQRRPSSAMMARLRTAAKPRPSTVLARHRDQIIALVRAHGAGHRAGHARVFGSAARGNDTSGSDIDLLVRFDDGGDAFDLADLIVALENLTGLHVDVVSEGGLRPGPNPIRDQAVPL